jgi:hypothetical protein
VLRLTDISVSPPHVSPFSHSLLAPVALPLLYHPPHRQPRPVTYFPIPPTTSPSSTPTMQQPLQVGDTYMYTFRHDASGWRCDANI